MSKIGQYAFELQEAERELAEMRTGSRMLEADFLIQPEQNKEGE